MSASVRSRNVAASVVRPMGPPSPLEVRPAADARRVRPQVAHPALRTALLAFRGRRERALTGRLVAILPLTVQDQEECDDADGERDRERQDLGLLVHGRRSSTAGDRPPELGHAARRSVTDRPAECNAIHARLPAYASTAGARP